MFHDIGLTEPYRSSMLRFEVNGGKAARDFLRGRGVDEAAIRKVWLSIAVETDVLGIDREEPAPEQLSAVTAAHPRPDFKRRILQAFTDGNKHRPRSTFGNSWPE